MVLSSLILLGGQTSCGDCGEPAPDEHLAELERLASAIDEGDTLLASSIIDSVKRQAIDSIDYYLGVELETRLWFALSNRDSFAVSSDKMHHFIERNAHFTEIDAHSIGKNAHSIDQRLPLLRALEQTQKGAYWARMMGRPDLAVVCDSAAIGLLDSMTPTPRSRKELLRTLTNVADAHQQLGQYDKTIHFYRRADQQSDSLGETALQKMPIWMGMACAYTNMGNFYQSQQWWDRCKQWADSMGPRDRFLYLNNRGNDLFLQKRYAESILLFLQLDTLTADKPHLRWEHAFGRTNLAALYLRMGHPEEADTLLGEVEAFFAAQPLPTAQYYITTLRLEQALLRQDMRLATRLSHLPVEPAGMPPQQVLLRLEALRQLYAATGQEVAEARTALRHTALQDSIHNDQMRMRFQAAVDEVTHEKMLNDKEQQLAKRQLEAKWAWAAATAAVLIIVLLVIIGWQRYRAVRMKQHLERQRMQMMQERMVRLKLETVRNRMTPHFLSNALSAPLLAQAEGRPVELAPLVALLHQGLQLTSQTITTLEQELDFIHQYVRVEQQNFRFEYVEDLAQDIRPDQLKGPSMLLQILVENALKHGLKALPKDCPRPRRITLRAWTDAAAGATVVCVEDTGMGCGASSQQGTKTGLDVVRKTLDLLNQGQPRPMTFDLGDLPPQGDGQKPAGCCARITIPHDILLDT